LAIFFGEDVIVNQLDNEPSLFKGALIGYAVGTLIGVAVTVGISFSAGEATAASGFNILAPISAIGVCIGFAQTVRRRKALNISALFDSFFDFLLSSAGYALVAAVLLGSAAIAVLNAIVFDLITTRGG
jgi:hypothetical protein